MNRSGVALGGAAALLFGLSTPAASRLGTNASVSLACCICGQHSRRCRSFAPLAPPAMPFAGPPGVWRSRSLRAAPPARCCSALIFANHRRQPWHCY